MENDLISIIVPVYNTEKLLLENCLNSISEQTYNDFEVVLVDDGSTNGSEKICDEYVKEDKRFKAIHQNNQGVAKARINGYNTSSGKYVTFIDSDDIVKPDYLRKLYDSLICEKADISCCQITRVYDGKETEEKHDLTGTFNREGINLFIKSKYLHDTKYYYRAGMPLYLCGKLFARDYLAEGLDAGIGLKLGEDQIALFAMLLKIRRITIIPDCLYKYIFHKGQTTYKFRPDFWENKLEVFHRYKELDKENLLHEQLPLRMWRVIDNAVLVKIRPLITSYKKFEELVLPVFEDDTVKEMFQWHYLQIGLKRNIKFWMLKYKLYRLYYFLCIKSKQHS